eukprot:TCONS_00008657-protein
MPYSSLAKFWTEDLISLEKRVQNCEDNTSIKLNDIDTVKNAYLTINNSIKEKIDDDDDDDDDDSSLSDMERSDVSDSDTSDSEAEVEDESGEEQAVNINKSDDTSDDDCNFQLCEKSDTTNMSDLNKSISSVECFDSDAEPDVLQDFVSCNEKRTYTGSLSSTDDENMDSLYDDFT